MHKTFACSMLMVASALVACGKDKHQEPAMTPAAGPPEQRQQTAPTMEGQMPEQQPMPQQPMMEGQPGVQDPSDMSGQMPMTEEPAMSDPWSPPSQPPSSKAGAQAQSAHALVLAETRCRRALRCDQIGDNKKHPSVEECEAAVFPEGNQALSSCPKGVSKTALSECVAAIDAKGCDTPMDSLMEFEQCRTTVLCAP